MQELLLDEAGVGLLAGLKTSAVGLAWSCASLAAAADTALDVVL